MLSTISASSTPSTKGRFRKNITQLTRATGRYEWMDHASEMQELVESFNSLMPAAATRRAPRPPTNREKIRMLHPRIEFYLSEEYSYEGIAELLEQQGIKLAVSTLKSYVRDFRIKSSEAKSTSETTVEGSANTDETPVEDSGESIADSAIEYIEPPRVESKAQELGSRKIEPPRPASHAHRSPSSAINI